MRWLDKRRVGAQEKAGGEIRLGQKMAELSNEGDEKNLDNELQRMKTHLESNNNNLPRKNYNFFVFECRSDIHELL